jgi:DNA-binding NarL/FixJ family response regulator
MLVQSAARTRAPDSRDSTSLYLIEDDPAILEFVREALLLRPGWRLLGVSRDLAHAREHALAVPANVFLVDLGLPDGRGEALLRTLATHKPDAELLVFTVFGDESRLIEALEAGATGYVLKGCAPQELVLAVEQIRAGGAPISPLLARRLLKRFRADPSPAVQIASVSSADQMLLSQRETEVLQLLAQGYVNKEIALRMGIAPATVDSHVKNLYRKLSVHSRVQVIRVAQERGLL